LRVPSRPRYYLLTILFSLIFAILVIIPLSIASSNKGSKPVSLLSNTPSSDYATITSASYAPGQISAKTTPALTNLEENRNNLSSHNLPTTRLPVSPKVAAEQITPTSQMLVQPLPLSALPEPLLLVRLNVSKGQSLNQTNLVKQLLEVKVVREGRLIPLEYWAGDQNTGSSLLALVPTADEINYRNLAQLEFKVLDTGADTARYYTVNLPNETAPRGEGWLDARWKILEQTGNRVLLKVDLPLFTGFGVHANLVYEKLPPRIYVPGLTAGCPCPGLATATFATLTPQVLQNAKLTETDLRNSLSKITQEDLRRIVGQLVTNEVRGKGALNTRYTGSSGSVYIAERIYTYFFALGLKVEYDTFVEGGLGSVTTNVIAEQPGETTGANAETVVVVAHYDSLGVRNLQGISDPKLPAFGANDNGVGVAGLFEIARTLAPYRLKQPIRYIAFGAEEQAMLGSQHYVNYHLRNEKLRAVFNIDSFGYNPDSEDWVILAFGTHGSNVRDALQANQKKYGIALRLEARGGEPFFRSDDYYFDKRGYPAVALTDSFNLQSPNNHTANDTVQNVNFRTTQKVIQLTLATVAELGGF
jgi:hypothetical protein